MRAIIMLMLCLSTASWAQTKVYQWTDEDGVVHFSTEPPPDPEQAVEERMVSGAPKAGTVAPETGLADDDDNGDDASAAPPTPTVNPAEEARRQAELCERGRQLVAMIEPARRVQKTNPDGSTEWVTGEQLVTELESARKLVRENCR